MEQHTQGKRQFLNRTRQIEETLFYGDVTPNVGTVYARFLNGVGVELTPAQAREIAAMLNSLADQAEAEGNQ